MKIAVLGGGAAGLAAGVALQAAGIEVELFEAEPVVGGKLRTFAGDGFRCEDGPNSLTPQSLNAFRIARERAIEILPARPPKSRYLVRKGRMRRLSPAGLAGLLSLRGLARLALEPLAVLTPSSRRRAAQDESLREMLARHLGEEAGGLAATLLANGVYAGDPRLLSARDAFPRLSSLSADSASLFIGALRRATANRGKKAADAGPRSLWIPVGGMGELTRALAEQLGGKVQVGKRVERLEASSQSGDERGYRIGLGDGQVQVDGVICALPPAEAARLLLPLTPVAGELARIRSSPLAVVHLGFRSQDLERQPAGFGALDGDGSLKALGILFPSSLFAGRAPEGHVLFTCLVGGVLRPELLRLDDAALSELCQADLRTLFGGKRPPVFERVARWSEAVPQFELGHGQLLVRVRARLAALPPMELTGAAYDGVSVEQVLEGGARAAARLLGRLGVGPRPDRVVEPIRSPDESRLEV